MDLLASLMTESGVVHTRRAFISLLVYMILLSIFVVGPIYIYTTFVSFDPMTWRPQVWFYLPQIQLPLEVAIGHIFFMTLLEKRKNILGYAQFQWFKFATHKLGLTQYILPVKRARKNRQGGNAAAREIEVNGNDNGNSNENDRGVIENPVPVVRPPRGWDARTFVGSQRWAWSEEEPAILEKSLAPQVRVCSLLFRGLYLFSIVISAHVKWCIEMP